MSALPTRQETYLKLMHHLEEAQNAAATISHLHSLQDNKKDLLLAQGWFGISELMKMIQHKVRKLAMGRLN